MNDMSRAIISHGEALQILRNDLRRLALEKQAAELKKATPERRLEIMARIDRDIQKELRKRSIRIEPDTLLHLPMLSASANSRPAIPA
jgi:hypothetical protein